MAIFARRGSCALAVLLGASSLASADVTPDEVWQAWRQSQEKMGYAVSVGAQQGSASRLVLDRVTLRLQAGDMQAGTENATDITITLPQLVLEQVGATVAVTLPPEAPIAIRSREEAVSTDLQMALLQDGARLIVSGDKSVMVSDFSAPQLSLRADQLLVDDEAQVFDLNAQLQGVVAQMRQDMVSGSQQQSGRAQSLSVSVDAEGEGAKIQASGQAQALVFEGEGIQPTGMTEMALLSEGLRRGLQGKGVIGYGASNLRMDLTEAAGNTALDMASQGAKVDFELGPDGIFYQTTSQGMVVDVNGAQMPFPIHATLSEALMGLRLPLLESPDAKPFALDLKLSDLALNKEVWALFDPASQLDRSPASLALALSGQVRLLAALDDPALAAGGANSDIFELHTANIDDLLLRIGGAELTGKGAFTFDTTAPRSPDSPPAPVGAANFRLLGGNALLDGLVAIGLVPQDQAMMVRMMSGVFAQPGPGADELNSTIEFREDGGFYANGQRLQ